MVIVDGRWDHVTGAGNRGVTGDSWMIGGDRWEFHVDVNSGFPKGSIQGRQRKFARWSQGRLANTNEAESGKRGLDLGDQRSRGGITF
jgi:hypothetical protein